MVLGTNGHSRGSLMPLWSQALHRADDSQTTFTNREQEGEHGEFQETIDHWQTGRSLATWLDRLDRLDMLMLLWTCRRCRLVSQVRDNSIRKAFTTFPLSLERSLWSEVRCCAYRKVKGQVNRFPVLLIALRFFWWMNSKISGMTAWGF